MTSADLYEYDASGNRTKKTEQRQGVTDVIITNTYNNMNQLVSSHNSGTGATTTPTYNDAGSLISDGTHTYGYDYYEKLTYTYDREAKKSCTYDYYFDDIRSRKGTTYYIWLDGNMVYEFTSTDSSDYTYGHRLISSDDYKYVLNAHGDVVALLDSTGTVIKRYDYDAFGNEQNIDSTDTNPFRYCAEYFDKETGQVYLRARYYQSVTGRFTQIDPIKDGLNWYAYCYNNPIVFVDPSGYKIMLSNQATSEQIREYNRAIEYLNNSKVAYELIRKIEDSEEVFTIFFTNNNETMYDRSDNTIYWDVRSGLVMQDGYSTQSAALGLAHEMGHVAQNIDGFWDKTISNLSKEQKDSQSLIDILEADNLNKYESIIAKQLGEPTRNTIGEYSGFMLMNNSTHFIAELNFNQFRHRFFVSTIYNKINISPISNKAYIHYNRYPIIGTKLLPSP